MFPSTFRGRKPSSSSGRQSAATASSSSSRKRPYQETTNSSSTKRRRDEDDEKTCSFCGQVFACILVQMPVPMRKIRISTPYCLTCYYTTSAVRQDASKYVSISNQEEMDAQLPPMQQLFSEAFVDLRKKLQEEADKAFSKQNSDPLSMLHSGSKSFVPRRRAPVPDSLKKKDGNSTDGGFFPHIPLPQGFVQTQMEQSQLYQAQISRMNDAAKAPTTTTPTSSSSISSSVYQRRKSSKKSIWNLAMDPNMKSVNPKEDEENVAKNEELIPSCSCGSRDVSSMGNITSRNQDLKKGETWGVKDRGGEVVSRYQCNSCGKTWNEEG